MITLLITGLLAMAAADTLFALGSAAGTYISGALSDSGWIIAFAAFTLAGRASAWQPMSLRYSTVIERWQLVLPYLPFVLAGAISVGQVLQGHQVDPVQAVALQLVFLLILARQLVTLMRNSALTTQLRFQAYHDPLTGLGNRALFTERLDEALAVRRRVGDAPAVLFLDLDDFKLINDTLGHDAGDDLLRAVADRLRDCFPLADAVSRLGGDEFAVLLPRTGDPAAEAERMLDGLRPAFAIGAHTVAVTASVGIADTASMQGRPITPEDLRKHVDLAMYAAKARGKNAYAVFEPAMRDTFDNEMALRDELGQALQAGSLYVVYQPIVHLGDQRVAGLEALARWQHPVIGEVPPATFIPVAERAGLVADIGLFVLDRACAEFAAWDGKADAYLSVNVSPLQLLDPTFADRVVATVGRYGMRPGQLVLEITETALADESFVIPALRRLRAAGMRIAIDDFGTGYSSLRYLHRFPADIVKIDRSYVQDIASDHGAGRLVATLWQMFSALGLAAVAEGVEDLDQARLLLEMGCPMAQGYLFGKPARIPDSGADGQDQLAHGTAVEQVAVGVAGPF